MAESYVKFTLTQAGEDIMTRIIGGETITFKRVAIGDGFDYDTENFGTRTSLVNEVLSLTNLTMTITTANQVKIVASFGSSDLQQSFWYREYGLYIVDPDDQTSEILYAYGNRNDEAEYITPDASNYGVLKELDAYVKVGNSANVNIYVTDNTVTTEIAFVQNDWTLDSGSGLYTLTLGAVNKVLKVCKTTQNGYIDTPGVDILENNSQITTLRSITAFTGCAIAI